MENQDYMIIPREIYANKDISPSARLLYGLILLRSHQKGYCWASNAYLAEQSGFGERSITRLIAELNNQGLLRIEQDPNRKKIRRLYIENYDLMVDKYVHVSSPDMSMNGRQICPDMVDKNVQQINNNYNKNYKNNYYKNNSAGFNERDLDVYNSDVDYDALVLEYCK